MFGVLLHWEFLKARRGGGNLLAMLSFFGMGVCLFAIALGGRADALLSFSGGILWVLVMLSLMLGQQRVFADDQEQGVLTDLLMRPSLLWSLVYAKLAVLFLLTNLPLLLFALLGAVMLQLPLTILLPLVIILALGLWSLCFLSAFGSLLLLGAKSGSLSHAVLLPLLILPLSLPVLIFGESAISNASEGQAYLSQLLFLTGYGLLNSVLCPPAMVYLLRFNAD